MRVTDLSSCAAVAGLVQEALDAVAIVNAALGSWDVAERTEPHSQ